MKNFANIIFDLLHNFDWLVFLAVVWYIEKMYIAGYIKGWERGFQDGLNALHKVTKRKVRKR